MTALLVTVDTNQLDQRSLRELRRSLSTVDHEIAPARASLQERGEMALTARVREGAPPGDDSHLFLFVDRNPPPNGTDWMDLVASRAVFHEVLAIISDGSFSPADQWDRLSRGHQRQFFDALIFEAHVRNCRHLFVTTDRTGFINHGKRGRLQRLGRTWIATPQEVAVRSAAGTLAVYLRPPGG